MLAILMFLLRYLAVICLFIFVGWIIYTLWRDLRFQSQVVVAQKIPALNLCLDSDPEGTSVTFNKPEVLIGRDNECDFQVKDESVSAHHARLIYRSSQWWVEDLESTNGTYLNDEKVETPTVIIKGDELRIGQDLLLVSILPLEL